MGFLVQSPGGRSQGTGIMGHSWLDSRVRGLALALLLSLALSADAQHEGEVSILDDLAQAPPRLQLPPVSRRSSSSVVLLDEGLGANFTTTVAQAVSKLGHIDFSGEALRALNTAAAEAARGGDYGKFRMYARRVREHLCTGEDNETCRVLAQLIRKIPGGGQAAADSRAAERDSTDDYFTSVIDFQTHYCHPTKGDAAFCATVKHAQASLVAGLKQKDLSGFTQEMMQMQLSQCSGAVNAQRRRCTVIQLLLDRVPKIGPHPPFQNSTLTAGLAQNSSALAQNSSALPEIAPSLALLGHVAASELPQGGYTSRHLTKQQIEFPMLLGHFLKTQCAQSSPLCAELQTLPKVYNHALRQQDKHVFLGKLSLIQTQFCASQSGAVDPNCQVLIALREKLPPLSHLGGNALARLNTLHQQYLKTTDDIWRSYCEDKKDSTIFCQLCRGLERTYRLALKAKTNHRYERLLTAMNDKFCTYPSTGQATNKRCQILPVLRQDMPISETTLYTLPHLHEDYLNTIDDASKHYCSKEPDSLVCEMFHGLKRLYIQALNNEDNHVVEKYIMASQDEFCVLQNSTKQCNLLQVMQDGLPPAFNAEGVKRKVEDLDVQGKKSLGQARMTQKLADARQQYRQTVTNVRDQYCKIDPRSYFCQVALGLVKNYAYSVDVSMDNCDYSKYLAKARESSCSTTQARKTRRCRILDIMMEDLPMSKKDEAKLLKQQNEYVKTIQDIVHHYCHSTPSNTFCQMTQGLLRHYLNAVENHNNEGMSAYLEEVTLHNCVKKSGGKNRCAVLQVLKKDLPKVALQSKQSIQRAEDTYTRSKITLQGAEKTRKTAEALVKANPDTVKLQTLEDDTSLEGHAQRNVVKARDALIDQMAEAKLQAPSRTVVKLVKEEEKRSSKEAVQAVEKVSDVERETQAHVSNLRKQSAEAKMVFATATTAVEAEPSAQNVDAVKAALTVRAKAALALTEAVKKGEKQVKQAKEYLKQSEAGAEAVRAHAKAMSLERKSAIAKEGLEVTKKETAKTKIAMLLSEVALERFKELKGLPCEHPVDRGQENYAELSQEFKESQSEFGLQSEKLKQAISNEASVKKEVKDRQDVLDTQQKLDREKQAADAASLKRTQLDDKERDQKLIARNALEASELATKKKADALSKEIAAKKAQSKAQEEISAADNKIKVDTLKAQEKRSQATKLKVHAQSLEHAVDAEHAAISKATTSLDEIKEKGVYEMNQAEQNSQTQEAASKAAAQELKDTEKAKAEAQAEESKAETGSLTRQKVAVILKRDREVASAADKAANRARKAKEAVLKHAKKARDSEKAKVSAVEAVAAKKKKETDTLESKAGQAKQTAAQLEKQVAEAKAAVEKARHGGVNSAKAKDDMQNAEDQQAAAKQAEAGAEKAAEKSLKAFKDARSKTKAAAEANAAKVRAVNAATEAKDKADTAESTLSELSEQQDKTKASVKKAEATLAEQLVKARKAAADAKAGLDEFSGADSKRVATNDLRKAEEQAKKAEASKAQLSVDQKSKQLAEENLSKISDKCLLTEKKESATHEQVQQAHAALKKAKSEEKGEGPEQLSSLKLAADQAAKKADIAGKEAKQAIKAQKEAKAMLEDAGSDAEARKVAAVALETAAKEAVQREKDAKAAKEANSEAAKAYKEKQESVSTQQSEVQKKVQSLEKQKDAAEKKAHVAENLVKDCIKDQQAAKKKLKAISARTSSAEAADSNLQSAQQRIKDAQARMVKAKENDVDKKAAADKYKSAKQAEDNAKQALQDKKSTDQTIFKKMKIEKDAAAKNAEIAAQLAAKAQGAAKRNKKRSEGLTKKAEGSSVEVLEEKAQEASAKVADAKNKVTSATTAALDAKAGLVKAADADGLKKQAEAKLEELKKKAGKAEQESLKLQAEEKKSEIATKEAADAAAKEREKATARKKKLRKQEDAAAKKLEDLEAKAKEADAARDKAENTAAAESEDQASKELTKTALDEAAKEEKRAEEVRAASLAARNKAQRAASVAKTSERKQKNDLEHATRKVDMKRQVTTRKEKQAEEILKQSRAAQDKAAEYAADVREVQRTKKMAQDALIKATKAGAKAKELMAKSQLQAEQAKQKVPTPPAANALEKETVNINVMIDGQVQTAKQKQEAAKETVAKAQQKAQEAAKQSKQARRLAEERARYQMREAEKTVCSSKAAVDEASEALSKDPSQSNIKMMKDAEAALGQAEADAGEANKAVLRLAIQIDHVICPTHKRQATTSAAPTSTKIVHTGKKLTTFRGDVGVLIPFYCSRPRYTHLCTFYKNLRRKGHLKHPNQRR